MFAFRPKSTTATSGPSPVPTSYGSGADTCPTKSCVLPSRHGARSHDRGFPVHVAGSRHVRSLGPGLAQVAGQRARVDARDRWHAVGAEQVGDLPRPAHHGRGGVGDDERAQPRPLRLIVLHQAAVVPDQRVGHHHHLAGVRRVGADLLVAGLAGVRDEIAPGRDRCPERHAGEDHPVLQRDERGSVRANPWIHHGIRGNDEGPPVRGDHGSRAARGLPHARRARLPRDGVYRALSSTVSLGRSRRPGGRPARPHRAGSRNHRRVHRFRDRGPANHSGTCMSNEDNA